MGPGDVLFTYTDGVTQARDPARRFFGKDKLPSILERPIPSAKAIIDDVVAGLHDHLAGRARRRRDDARRTTPAVTGPAAAGSLLVCEVHRQTVSFLKADATAACKAMKQAIISRGDGIHQASARPSGGRCGSA